MGGQVPDSERTGPASTDAKIAYQMMGLADAFVRGSAEEGVFVEYDAESAYRLDSLIDLFLRNHSGKPPTDLVQSMTITMGAFLGEVIVRSHKGTWVLAPEPNNQPGIRLSASTLICFPLAKVNKRLTIGPEHSITQFFDTALTGVIPPGARRVDPPRN